MKTIALLTVALGFIASPALAQKQTTQIEGPCENPAYRDPLSNGGCDYSEVLIRDPTNPAYLIPQSYPPRARRAGSVPDQVGSYPAASK
jgi:hypothetical protein